MSLALLFQQNLAGGAPPVVVGDPTEADLDLFDLDVRLELLDVNTATISFLSQRDALALLDQRATLALSVPATATLTLLDNRATISWPTT